MILLFANSQVASMLPGIAVVPYAVRELLFGWLLFASVFVFLVLVVVGSVTACHAAKSFMQWMRTRFATVKAAKLFAAG